jgi:hypothetical protein
MITLCNLISIQLQCCNYFEVPRSIVQFYRLQAYKGYHTDSHVYTLAGGPVAGSPRRHNLADDQGSLVGDGTSNLPLSTRMP